MIFLDTSAIYALADEADPNHERANKRLEGYGISAIPVPRSDLALIRTRKSMPKQPVDGDTRGKGVRCDIDVVEFPAQSLQPSDLNGTDLQSAAARDNADPL